MDLYDMNTYLYEKKSFSSIYFNPIMRKGNHWIGREILGNIRTWAGIKSNDFIFSY